MAIERTARARPRLAGSADPDAGGRIRFGPPADPDRAEERLRAGISGVRLALGLVDLTDMRVEAVSNAVSDVLGLPVDRIVGRKAEEVIDARDRPGATAALEALRTGAIDFYRAYRGGAGITAPRRICAWVRRLDLSGRPHAFVRFGDPHLPPGPWPTGVDVFENAVAIAVTDGHGVVQTASVYADVGDNYSLDDIIGVRLVPSSKIENLVTLSEWRTARIEGVSIAYAAPVRNSEGDTEELEGHLWRIAAELEASGILMRADRTPGLSLARIGEAASLTPRQWEVLRRVTAGQRVPTIARELYVSQSTVRNHLAAIFQRFGVHSQADLLARLAEADPRRA